MRGFFSSTLSEIGGHLHPIPNKELRVYQKGFVLAKGNQLESTAFSINCPLTFLLELFIPK